ncbi:MAG: hypothetical protein B6I29_01325 [Marinitoga sp. 4572_148]|nr:MAG: hypothetical protein B6I29_01325 [Marinitoga sp. 4572_148]
MNYYNYVNFQKEINKNSRTSLINNWKVTEGISKKVDSKGYYLEFIGNTTLIFLNSKEIAMVRKIQQQLYSQIGELLATPLNPDTFHVTIHDLCNPYTSKDVYSCMTNTEEKIKKLFNSTLKKYINITIKLESIGLFNGNSAIGIQFIPSTKKDFDSLIDTYNIIDTVFPLNSTLIPHVTLGYYKPINYSIEERKRIVKAIEDIKSNISLNLFIKNLSLQKFFSMNEYKEVFTLMNL